MSIILDIDFARIFTFADSPGRISINYLSNYNLIAFYGVDAGGIKLGKELRSGGSGSGRTNAFAHPADLAVSPIVLVETKYSANSPMSFGRKSKNFEDLACFWRIGTHG